MVLPSVSVVSPALNEARNIPHVFARTPSDVHEVILVDGCSVDGTVSVARELRPDVRILRQTRMVKRNALARGVAAGTGDTVALVDADSSVDPSEIPLFAEELLNGADFAKRSRFLEGGGSNDTTRLRSLDDYAITIFFDACYGRNHSDLCHGLNFISAARVGIGHGCHFGPRDRDGQLCGDGFEVEAPVHARVANAGRPSCEANREESPMTDLPLTCVDVLSRVQLADRQCTLPNCRRGPSLAPDPAPVAGDSASPSGGRPVRACDDHDQGLVVEPVAPIPRSLAFGLEAG